MDPRKLAYANATVRLTSGLIDVGDQKPLQAVLIRPAALDGGWLHIKAKNDQGEDVIHSLPPRCVTSVTWLESGEAEGRILDALSTGASDDWDFDPS